MQPYGLLEACRFEELNQNTPVFNIYALDSGIWIHVPSWLKGYSLINILDISAQFPVEVAFTSSTLAQACFHPWIRISTSILDLTSGQHVYKLIFRNKSHKCESQSAFVSYIARDNNPKTPYIYMPNRGNPTDTNTKDYNYTEEYVTDD